MAKRKGGKGASAQYKKDLEKLFSNSGEVPERFKDAMAALAPKEGSEEAAWRERVQALRDALAEGFRPFVAAISAFVEGGDKLPDDEELLLRALDHPSEKVLRPILAHLIDLDERRTLTRLVPIKSRLRTIRTMSEDPRTLKLVGALDERLTGR